MVRAETHRFGAVFPSWVQDHQVETEGAAVYTDDRDDALRLILYIGFGVMARQVGGRVVGLQNYLVYHYCRSSAMLLT